MVGKFVREYSIAVDQFRTLVWLQGESLLPDVEVDAETKTREAVSKIMTESIVEKEEYGIAIVYILANTQEE